MISLLLETVSEEELNNFSHTVKVSKENKETFLLDTFKAEKTILSYHSIRKTNIIFKLSYVIFVALNLCPQLLLEFRYFVIPFIMYRLQVRPTNWTKLILENILFLGINALTIYIFVMKPFKWEQNPEETQRFMW